MKRILLTSLLLSAAGSFLTGCADREPAPVSSTTTTTSSNEYHQTAPPTSSSTTTTVVQ